VASNLASIRIHPNRPTDKLDATSRINYAKIYTIEYNVKIQSVGEIDRNHIERFLESFRIAHSPLRAGNIAPTLGEFLRRIRESSAEQIQRLLFFEDGMPGRYPHRQQQTRVSLAPLGKPLPNHQF
jgi:hypothetical protein